MTTFSYSITLNDREAIALKASLELMIDHCQNKIEEGCNAPYWAHKESAKKILEKLYDNTKQTSGSF